MTISTLVDSNILIDVVGPVEIADRQWSLSALKESFENGPIVFSAIVWAELAGFPDRGDALARALAWLRPKREDFPFGAAHLAGSAHMLYRQRGGRRERTLPDFLIGAHASFAGYRLLTRDSARYRTYFPSLDICAPDTHP